MRSGSARSTAARYRRGDMTSEAAVTKLMWLLERGLEPAALAQAFKQNLHGEISE